MKAVILTLIFSVSTASGATKFCDDPLRAEKTCYEMKNLRSHIMILEAQRDLLQLNYEFLLGIASSLGNTANLAAKNLPEEMKDHALALKNISASASEIGQLAILKSPDALVKSNNLRVLCASCHSSQSASSGYSWSDIFKTDWSKIVERCNSPGRNPLLCKQMHGLITNYSYISTAYFAGILDYDMLAKTTGEIARIAGYLLDNNLVHNMNSDSLAILQAAATDAQSAAVAKDPSTMDKAFRITESCMECHGSQQPGYINKLSVSPF